jgi:single-strand DNA-binding protein
MARSLNKAELIGNLTRDPELRYTPKGTAVCNFGLATNRQWTTESGEKKEDVEFHRIVSWNKLAELCSQLLSKGRKVYVEGRLQTRRWTTQDGTERTTTEIVISDMIILDSRGAVQEAPPGLDVPEEAIEASAKEEAGMKEAKERKEKKVAEKKTTKRSAKSKKGKSSKESTKKINGDDEDIPF